MKERENYLLFVPSLLTERAEMYTYTAGEKAQQYVGMQTNEAVSKYLADYLHEQGTSLTKIIMLCSKEVCQNKINKADGHTTLEYYKDSIWRFLEKYEEEYKEKEDLFETIPLKSENKQTAEDIVEPIKQVLEITEGKQIDVRKHLYVDFTGGMRNAALTLVFACRILQRLGVAVDKILYSNISSKTVEECTKTYDYFEFFEYLVKREYNPDNFDRYDEMIKKYPKQEQEKVKEIVKNFKLLQEQKELNKYDKIADTSKKIMSDVKQLESGSGSTDLKKMKELLNEDCKNVQVFAENEKYPELPMIEEYLRNKQYEKAFNLYREKIINILYKGKIIQVNKRFLNEHKNLKEYEVTQEIVGAYCYYEHPNKIEIANEKENSNKEETPRKTFMDAVELLLEQLGKAPDQPPKEVFEKTMGTSFYDIMKYFDRDQIPKKGFTHNSFSQQECNNKIFPYLKSVYGKKNFREFMDTHNKLDRIYMCHGFPFAATYDKWYLKGYDQMYRKILERGVECLQDFYKKRNNKVIVRMLNSFPDEKFNYRTLILALQKDKYDRMLHILFPYRLKAWNVFSDILKGEEWDDFIYNFVKSFYFIKKVRNDKIHKNDLNSEDMQDAISRMKESLDVVKKYIH